MKTKRLWSILLTATIVGSAAVCAVPATAATAHPNLLIGDADRDGQISVKDVTETQRYLAEMITFDEQTVQMAKTDFTRENLTIADTTNIQRHLAEHDYPEAREVGQPAFVWKARAYVPALQEYQNYADKQMSAYNVSGVAYVTRNGRVLCQSANGLANTAENQENTLDTRFAVGSVSKQFCAAAVLLLQEQGKLSVNDKLEKYYPEYTIGKDITLHQLLAMRSGIRDHVNADTDYQGHEVPMEDYTIDPSLSDEQNKETLLDWLFGQELKFTPGSKYHYSNTNFFLLADIVEKVTGEPYSPFVQKNILQPLKMNHTGFYADLADASDLAEQRMEIPAEVLSSVVFTTKGCGDMVFDAADMDKWMNSLRNGTLLSKESLTAMTTNYSGTSGYGYGIGINQSNGALCHLGDVLSYESYMMTFSAENLNIFVVTNDVAAVRKKNTNMATFAENLAKKIHS